MTSYLEKLKEITPLLKEPKTKQKPFFGRHYKQVEDSKCDEVKRIGS